MKHTAPFAVLAVASLFIVGCGNGYEVRKQLADELIEEVNDLGDTLESVKDKETAKAAAEKVNEHCDRLADIKKRGEAAPKMTKSDHEKLMKDFQPRLEKAQSRVVKLVMRATLRSRAQPELVAALKRFRTLSN